MVKNRLRHFAFLLTPFLLIAFTGCTQKKSSGTVRLQLPGQSAAGAKAAFQTSSVGSWGLVDPRSFDSISCYIVTVGADEAEMREHSFKNLDASVTNRFGPFIGLIAAGGSVSLEAKSGPARQISVYGLSAQNGTSDCASLSTTLDGARYSAPHFLGSVALDIVPGDQAVKIELDWARVVKMASSDILKVTAPTAPLPGDFAVTGITGGVGDTVLDAWLTGGNYATINWMDATGEVSYSVSIRNASDTADVCAAAIVPANSVTYSFSSCSLDQGTTYKAKVLALNSLGQATAAINNLYAFIPDSVSPVSPNTFALITPASVPSNVATPVISVSPVAIGDFVQVYSDAGCTIPVASVTATTSPMAITIPALSAQGTYSFHATSTDPANNRSPCSTGAAGYVFDSVAPTVTSVTSAHTDGDFGTGGTIQIQVIFSETVSFSGTSGLTLGTGAVDKVANFSGGSGTPTLLYNYVVQAGDVSADLDYVGTAALSASAPIRDVAGNAANLTLPSPGAAGSLGANKNFVVNGPPSPFKILGVTGGTDTYADGVLDVGSYATITWEASARATSYDVTIYETDGTTVKCATVNKSPGVTTHTFPTCSLTDRSYYKVKVVANGSIVTPATNGLFTLRVNSWWTPTKGIPVERFNHSAVWTGSEMIVWGGQTNYLTHKTGGRYNPTSDTWAPTSLLGAPTARTHHSAVWSGTKMIVWGGADLTGSITNTGGRYDPSADTWSATSVISPPAARKLHTAVWANDQMIIWGGSTGIPISTGAKYNPTTDVWTAVQTSGAPSQRTDHSAVWTGSKMIIWGGHDGSSLVNSGALYDPTLDSWSSMLAGGGGPPTPRFHHTGVWTGSKFLVWGGAIDLGLNRTNTGGLYDPGSNTWTATSVVSAPVARIRHSAVWSGTRLLIWGGFGDSALGDGAKYDPSGNTWTPMSSTVIPTRVDSTAVWTGTEMIVWGGYSGDNGGSIYQDGGRYNPDLDAWLKTSQTFGNPTARKAHTAVWTGSEMIIWGGINSGTTATGSRYNLAGNFWTPTSTVGAPSARSGHTAVWTDTKMIVWGGGVNTGGRYDPVTDTWAATSTTGAPSARSGNTAIWTGSIMIVWGGGSALNNGSSYTPESDTWSSISTTGAPTGRSQHVAVWTGTEMVVWGGLQAGSVYANTGGRYNPVSSVWTSTSTGVNVPETAAMSTAVWTGSEMIVFGGKNAGTTYLDTGGRYKPSTDTWSQLATSNRPIGRHSHSAIWTGSKMIIWGGIAGMHTHTGSIYDPANNTWYATPVKNEMPSGRNSHTAVWTGSKMIIWGGADGYGIFSGGGIFEP